MTPNSRRLDSRVVALRVEPLEPRLLLSVSVWQKELVAAGALNFDEDEMSLALDASGEPGIAWYDEFGGNLMYAHRDAGSWAVETVDYAGDVGENMSLAFDPSGNPAISYNVWDHWHAAQNQVRLARFDGTSWNTTVVATGDVGSSTDVAFSASGDPAVAYYEIGAVKAWMSSWSGTVEAVTEETAVDVEFSPATDRPALAYHAPGTAELHYAAWDGSSWAIETVEGNQGEEASLAFDSAGYPGISYHDDASDELNYAYDPGLGWVIQVLSGPGEVVAGSTSLDFDSNDYPGISYYAEQEADTNFVRWDGAAWQTQTVADESAESTSLAFDSSGAAHLAYVPFYRYGESDAQRDLIYARQADVPAGINSIEMMRGEDYEYPGGADDMLEFDAEVIGYGITRVQMTAPWGETFDSADYVGTVWDGGDYEYEDSSFGFEAWTVGGQGTMYFGFEDLTTAEWDALDTNAISFTVTHQDGIWSDSADFAATVVPTQAPNITSPSHGAANVALSPVGRWDQWTSPGAGAAVHLYFEDNQGGGLEFETKEAPADLAAWVPPVPLETGHSYEFDVGFYNEALTDVGGVPVTQYSGTTADIDFTVGSGGAITELIVDRGTTEGPGAQQSYEYSVELAGMALERLQVNTP
ncbi:MAG: hypothetical protein ACOC7T_05170 [Planctomycetota bacterium]